VVLALAPSALPASAGAPVPVARCTVDDPRLEELSGLAVVDGAMWAVADGGRRVRVHRLDPATCAVVDTRTADVNPDDPEDLAVGPDGALWVGDIGDNGRDRDDVAVIVVPPQGAPRLHRLVYPDGPQDAEALLVDARGVPTLVTKNIGSAGIYRTEAALTGEGPVPLVRVGDLDLPSSDTRGGPLGGFAPELITGGAVSADGRVVAVRTYTDAWLFPVPDGGAVADALRGTPVRVPLPDEPQGEALAFTADGTLLSGSESRGAPGQIRAVPGAAALASDVRAAPSPTEPDAAPGGASDAPLTVPVEEPASAWRTAAIGAAMLVVVLGVLAGLLAGHARRR
jgi:hypothetical protein